MSDDDTTTTLLQTKLLCLECGAAWDDPAERWRLYLTIANEPGLFCADCSRREFDGS